MKQLMLALILLALMNLPMVVQSEENTSVTIFGFDGVFYRVDELNKTLYPVEIINAFDQTEGYPAEKDEPSLQEKLKGLGAEAGDIIFGGKGKGDWPDQTGHVGILEKDSTNSDFYVREAYPFKGVQSISIPDFMRNYGTVHIYRVKDASQDQRRAAAEKALSYSGSYDLSAGIKDDTKWYCSKLAWRAYADTSSIYIGIDCPKRVWPCVDVSPCDIVKSENVKYLGNLLEGGFDCGLRWCGC